MTERKQFVWRGQVQSGNGQVENVEVRTYWDPERTSGVEMGNVAAIEFAVFNKVPVSPVGAFELVV